jgi:hypothetical protein
MQSPGLIARRFRNDEVRRAFIAHAGARGPWSIDNKRHAQLTQSHDLGGATPLTLELARTIAKEWWAAPPGTVVPVGWVGPNNDVVITEVVRRQESNSNAPRPRTIEKVREFMEALETTMEEEGARNDVDHGFQLLWPQEFFPYQNRYDLDRFYYETLWEDTANPVRNSLMYFSVRFPGEATPPRTLFVWPHGRWLDAREHRATEIMRGIRARESWARINAERERYYERARRHVAKIARNTGVPNPELFAANMHRNNVLGYGGNLQNELQRTFGGTEFPQPRAAAKLREYARPYARRAWATDLIRKSVIEAMLNPRTQLGKRRLLREFEQNSQNLQNWQKKQRK